MIDSNLNWKNRINYIITKIRRSIGVLSKLRYYVNANILTQLYYSLIFPFITYGLTNWGNTYISNLKTIVTLQKKALRIMSFSNYNDHTSYLFKQFNILKFIELVELYNSLFMYDYFTDRLPKVFDNFFIKIIEFTTIILGLHQNKLIIFLQLRQLNYDKFSLRFNGVKIWNSINESDKHLSRKRFKKKFTYDKITKY